MCQQSIVLVKTGAYVLSDSRDVSHGKLRFKGLGSSCSCSGRRARSEGSSPARDGLRSRNEAGIGSAVTSTVVAER